VKPVTGKSPFLAAYRGACLTCPRCGRGKLFRAYLKLVERCAACNEKLAHIRADDGPAWLTILIVGHVVGGLLLYSEMRAPMPVAVSIGVFLTLAVAMILYLLPRAKGVFAGIIWALDATGIDKVPSRLHAPPSD
jgi:uncharacterized protein (DUF983 family)